jgi:hypothetical protein
MDTMQLAARIADENARYHCHAIFIDGGGVGGGVVDRCRQLGLQVTEVQFGARSDRAPIGEDGAIVYANKRAEIWRFGEACASGCAMGRSTMMPS